MTSRVVTFTLVAMFFVIVVAYSFGAYPLVLAGGAAALALGFGWPIRMCMRLKEWARLPMLAVYVIPPMVMCASLFLPSLLLGTVPVGLALGLPVCIVAVCWIWMISGRRRLKRLWRERGGPEFGSEAKS
jgi:hypothetical protein